MAILSGLVHVIYYSCKRRKSIWFWILIIQVIGLLLWALLSALLIIKGEIQGIDVDLSNNYFRSTKETISDGFVVENDKCKVPDIFPWSGPALQFFKKSLKESSFKNCRNHPYYNLTFVENDLIIINEEVLNSHGFDLEEVQCCYRMIERVQQSLDNYDENADNGYRYSPECLKMERKTKPITGFVKVSCKSYSWFEFGTLLYENFHLVAVLPEEGNSSIARKIQFWRENGGKDAKLGNSSLPPNVIIFGLDSTSRINFRRFMFRTMELFDKVLKPVEMEGYTKVGENTFQNMVPFLSSYSLDELKSICLPNRKHPQDDCPYIWKEFSARNYLTAELEDLPEIAVFNHLKTAFVNPPTDIYIRPLMQAAYDERGWFPSDNCFKHQLPEEMIINYAVDLATLSDSKGMPFFIYSWMTHLTHERPSNVKNMDELLAEALLKLHLRGLLKNTLLLVMGDHGYRYFKIRTTPTGWIEDKMPALWIRLPETLSIANPFWVKALQYNSNQLLTPFNMYRVFEHVLNGNLRGKSGSLRDLSPFQFLPARTCKEAGVPDKHCPCSLPVEFKSNLDFLKKAAHAGVTHLNSILPKQCSKLSVKKITASGVSKVSGSEDYYVSFSVTPGAFEFEVILGDYDEDTEKFGKVIFHRLNKITRGTGCLSTDEKIDFETSCYCWLILF